MRIPGTESSEQKFTISARPLIQAAKALKGKMELSIVAQDNKLEIVSDKGGSIVMAATGDLKDAGFAKKPKKTLFVVPVESGFEQMAAVFEVIAQDIESQTPTINTTREGTYVTAVSPGTHALYASWANGVESMMGDEVVQNHTVSAYMDFWRSLKALKGAGHIVVCQDGVIAVAGNVECFSAPYRVSPYDSRRRTSDAPRDPDPWPRIELRGTPDCQIKMDKKSLIDSVKGVAPQDEHARVTIEVVKGRVKITGFGVDTGITLPVETTGEGVRSMNSNYLLSLVRAFSGKDITMAWSKTQPAVLLTADGYENWMTLLAPVALS